MEVLNVVAAVFRRGETVLACRRSPDRASGGLWEFPGGKLEAGEAPRAALEREIAEELGVAVRVGRLLNSARTEVGPLEINLMCFEVSAFSTPTSSSDHDSLRWVTVTEAQALTWAAPDRPMVALLDYYLKV
ncbi:(deoxy)nucleoside triphosphate pyrophosphohydrolase [Herbiconiux sp. CPCC 203406]|uniref:(deoxy)nucleoside triphosphate pyrophosphohydrolase n=1 Tax=Herbiconiux oxytropis TaxID=2970915 RepID=UPI00217CD23B|nr:(deoxy)nucleoside triphosphate pyrophosphohydrolase [Herbiconiux oxytropis]MCS5723471.1 (deoxy)nucleoside triphosphate pyrophosphohydrolase [Herbiconiux oxytropis]